MLNPRGDTIEYLGRTRILDIALEVVKADRTTDVKEIDVAYKLRWYLKALDNKQVLTDHNRINALYDAVTKLGDLNDFPWVPTLTQKEPPAFVAVAKGPPGDSIQGEKGDTGAAGAAGLSIQSAAFVGNDLVLTMTDLSTVTITNGKTDLAGSAGSNGTDGDDGGGLPLGSIAALASAVADSKFGAGGLGIDDWDGWALADGRNSTDDLRGRFPVGLSNLDANDYGYTNDEKNRADYDTKAKVGGLKEITLQEGEMPIHKHTGTADSDGAHSHTAEDRYPKFRGKAGGSARSLADDDDWNTRTVTTSQAPDHSHNITINDAGSGQAHENRPPYFVVRFAQKITEVLPPATTDQVRTIAGSFIIDNGNNNDMNGGQIYSDGSAGNVVVSLGVGLTDGWSTKLDKLLGNANNVSFVETGGATKTIVGLSTLRDQWDQAVLEVKAGNHWVIRTPKI